MLADTWAVSVAGWVARGVWVLAVCDAVRAHAHSRRPRAYLSECTLLSLSFHQPPYVPPLSLTFSQLPSSLEPQV